MTSEALLPLISPDQYLKGEISTSEKHEFVAGRVFAMGGASEHHNLIAGNLYSALRSILRGGPCRVFISDMKVRVDAADAYYYPDILVTCDPSDTDPYFKKNPCFIAEVLSPTTETIDRREKLLAYQKIESLREYALISTDRRRIQIYRRFGEHWLQVMYEDNDDVVLDSVSYTFGLHVAYEGITDTGL